MSTSMIMRPLSPHTPRTPPTTPRLNIPSTLSLTPQIIKRSQSFHRLYTNSCSQSQSSLLSPSSTDNAASVSFILDANSPLNLNYNPDQIKRFNSCTEEAKICELLRRRSNIQQNEHIIPPKAMKKQPTKKELNLVLHHFKMAAEKDIEAILRKHEPHVIYYRDKLYAEARQSGITAKSNDYIRLKILGAVVQFTYMNIEPPNEYTKKTDRKHFKEVAAWAAKFAKDRGRVPSVSLLYSAWCHDIERFIPSTKCEYLPEAVDKYRKQVIHGITSAKVAACLLKGAPVTKEETQRIYQMIMYHDIPHPRENIVILDQILVAAAPETLMEELGLLMDADSFAFFQSTIYFFILFKSKKNSPDWIWERVRNNIKRLRPCLREKAVKCINVLPNDLLIKMSVNYTELRCLCSASGIKAAANPNIDFIQKLKKNVKINQPEENEPILPINQLKISKSTSDSTADSADSQINDVM